MHVDFIHVNSMYYSIAKGLLPSNSMHAQIAIVTMPSMRPHNFWSWHVSL